MRKEYFESFPVPRAIAKFAIPTILSQMITLIYNLADTFFVGHTNDPDQVAALTLSFPIFMFLTGIGNLMGIGANSLISRSLGCKKPEQAKKAACFGFYGGIVLTIIFMIIQYIFMKPILMTIGASNETFDFTSSYLMWTVVIGGLPTVIALIFGHLVRAEGNSKQASIGMSMGGIINIILDPLMVSTLNLGITGAAIATVISNIISMIYFIIIIYKNRKKSVVKISPKYLGINTYVMSQVILVGFPAALVIIFGSTANIILTHYMAPYGDINVAAFGIVEKVGTVAIQITVGITQGIMPLIGYNYAAENYLRTREVCKDSFILLGLYALFCLVMIELFPNYIISSFIKEDNTVSAGVSFLKRWILSIPGMCFVNMFNSVFQAMGKWKQSMFLSTVRQMIMLLPLLIILNSLIGLYGLIWAQPISDTISLLIGILLYIHIASKNLKIKNK